MGVEPLHTEHQAQTFQHECLLICFFVLTSFWAPCSGTCIGWKRSASCSSYEWKWRVGSHAGGGLWTGTRCIAGKITNVSMHLPGFVQSINGVYIHLIPCTMCHVFVFGIYKHAVYLTVTAIACSVSFVQDGQNILHRAATGGNVSLFDWLVKRYGLQPDQWSRSKASTRYVFTSPMAYHLP